MFMQVIVKIFLFLYNVIEHISIMIMKHGPIPTHVAFIMDGNRRWAKGKQLETIQGHVYGYKTLENTLKWCEKLGISVVTVFAFSIENFKRPKKEVDALMTLADEKFKEMLKHPSILDKHKICVRVLGRLDLLPDYVRESAQRVMDYSRKYNNNVIFNMCFPYTSTDEISQSIKHHIILQQQQQQQEQVTAKVSVNSINEMMYTRELTNPDPDLLIRTSGEIRLSDFFTWQSSGNSMLSFTSTMWPDFSIWTLLFILLKYQLMFPDLSRYRKTLASMDEKSATGKTQA